MHELQHAGQSTVEIAHSLGLPVTLVMESLGIQVTAESTAIATGSLSITV
jgi:cobyrinic acid a,c-diamide synthase